MKLKADYSDLKKRYPEAVAAVEQQMKKSKSKSKPSSPAAAEWYFEWCVSMRSFSFAEILAGKDKSDNEQKVHASIAATAGRGYWSEGLSDVPQEILAHIEQEKQDREKESERFENLSEEEKQAETDELLKQLSKYPGFRAFGVRP